MVTVEPIRDNDLTQVCAFWRSSFNSKCPQEIWERAFQRNWYVNKPNNGFLLRDGGTIVGALGAIYSQQIIRGRTELFCNLTSWYVCDAFRNRSAAILLKLIKQRGFHFTNFSANETVKQVLLNTGFKTLSGELTAVPNLPLSFARTKGVVLLDEPDAVARVLPDVRRKICFDHGDCCGVRQLAIGDPGSGYCHIIYTTGRCRNLSCAIIHDVGDPGLLKHFWQYLSTYFLFHTGALVTRIESRLLPSVQLPYSFALSTNFKGLFLSTSLECNVVGPLYSEVLALRGC